MEIDLALADTPAHAQRAEALGYAGLLVPEAVHDGTLVALLALEHTQTLRVSSGVLVAFARSPMLVAQGAWDLQRFSGGRYALGLGSQVKGNIVGRFGLPWSAPAPRMRDYVLAIRAIFDRWQNGTPLAFESKSYTLNRMQPYFDPGPIDHPDIPILLGGVNPGMTRVAGEVADAMMLHPTHSDPRYLREVTRPALEVGARRGGRDLDRLNVIASPFIATGATASAVAESREGIRETLSFLYSTPAYRPALEHRGWAKVGERLHALSRAGRWTEMRAALGDEVLDAFVPTGTYDEIADILLERYASLASGITFPMPADRSLDAKVTRVVRALAES